MEKKRISDYKALARMTMKEHYGTMLLAVVIMVVIEAAISSIFRGLMYNSSLVMCIAYSVLNLLVSIIIIGPLSIGLNGFFLKCISGDYNVKNVFLPFKTNLTNTVKVYFFMQLKLFLWLLIPWLIGMIIVVGVISMFNTGSLVSELVDFFNMIKIDIEYVTPEYTKQLAELLAIYYTALAVSIVFMIPGIIKSFEYAMIPYIVADEPDVSVKEAFRRTKLMMKGNKFRYFALSLSFIGWMLLGMMVFVFGIIFVVPYIQAATAHFYIDAKSRIDGEASFYEDSGSNYRDMDKGDSFGI